MKQIWVSSVFERCLLICSRPCLQNHKVLRGSSGYWLKAQMIRVNCNTRKALFPSKGEAPQPQKKRKYHCYDNCPPFSFWISFFFNLFFLFFKLSEKESVIRLRSTFGEVDAFPDYICPAVIGQMHRQYQTWLSCHVKSRHIAVLLLKTHS